jgi:hypothetical protein
MVAMKKTLLEIVQDILNDLDSDTVNSISDTEESDQVTDIVIQTYFDLISDRVVPEHFETFRLDAAADATRPTHLILPDDVSTMQKFWYNKTLTTKKEFKEIYYKDPLAFLEFVNSRTSDATDITISLSIDNSVELLVFNDRHPAYYTSFDNKYIVCDAHKSTLDTTLQQSKTMAYGEVIPTVTRSDAFVFDFESKYFPYLTAEAKSRAFSVTHKTLDQKTEQVARRHKSFIQKEKYRIETGNSRTTYGR